ncbi:MAG: hypothetical protein F6K13_16080, partial [Okeania sp. SIO2B9]|nr:hypothetical protein [Okeania sp. SIO2B9]
EDELIVAENITRNLNKLGYEVLGIVDSGEEAIQTARKKHPNLLRFLVIFSATISSSSIIKIFVGYVGVLTEYSVISIEFYLHKLDNLIVYTIIIILKLYVTKMTFKNYP